MRLLVSFFLSVIVYSLIMIFLYFVFFHKNQPKVQQVFIHTAIVVNNTPKLLPHKNKTNKTHVEKKQNIKKTKKINKAKKQGSKTSLTKSGDVNFNEIFKNVKYNVDTKKLHLKKQLNISRLKGEVLKNLQKIRNINITYKVSGGADKGKVNKLIKKIYEIWDELSFIPGEYATIQIVNQNGRLSAVILESNIDINKQKILINRIKNLTFDEPLNLTVKFQTKVNK